jgi:hypothetical protein
VVGFFLCLGVNGGVGIIFTLQGFQPLLDDTGRVLFVFRFGQSFQQLIDAAGGILQIWKYLSAARI